MIDVLVAGAGPTGLALAAQIHAHGGRVRIIERRPPGYRLESPALVVQPRTLEVLEPLGIAPTLVERGVPAERVQVHSGRRVVSAAFTGSAIEGSAYPFLLAIPQAKVEAALHEHLRAKGVDVEWGSELTGFEQRSDGIECFIQRQPGHCMTVRARYLVGCDGADSRVRDIAGISFPGSAYRRVIMIGDLRLGSGPPSDSLHVFLGSLGILFLFPLGEALWRVLVARPRSTQRAVDGKVPDDERRLDDFRDATVGFDLHGLQVEMVEWLRELRLRRGQAVNYRAGRVLLAGDAAHVHSPAGAQGMNTGIQDAANLGWKLALLTRGLSVDSPLDSYQAERWKIARWTRRATDLAFAIETSDRFLPRTGRRVAAMYMAPLVGGRIPAGIVLRVVGGLLIRYRQSPIVEDQGPSWRGVRAGDRVPNVLIAQGGRTDWLHHFLTPPGFHLLLCGPLKAWDDDRLLNLNCRYGSVMGIHRLGTDVSSDNLYDPKGEALKRLGVNGSAQFLVRPDGYVAFRTAGPNLEALSTYLARWFVA